MANVIGTYDIGSLLAARFQSVAAFGLDTIRQVLEADIAAHNVIVNQMVGEIAELTVDRQRIYGTSTDGDMIEVDEFGRAPSQRSVTGATVGFPLKSFQFPVGWTEKWMATRTPADMATMTLAAEKAHLRAIQREIKRALFASTNYTFNDHLVDKVDLAVKRLVNADSAAIPNGPNGETFTASTHDHYNANATLTAAVLTANIEDVLEHGHSTGLRIAISRTDEAAVRALTGFVAYVDPRVVYRATDTGPALLDVSRLDNRAIGLFSGAEVWVKPWMMANYAFAWAAGDPNKPLCFRQRNAEMLQGLRIAATLNTFPLVAQYLEAEYGLGVWTRTNGAILQFNSGTWSDPTIS